MGRLSAEKAEAGVGWGKDLNWIITNPSFSWDGAKVLAWRQAGCSSSVEILSPL